MIRSQTLTGKRLKWGSTRLDSWPFLFLLYINDLPRRVTKDSNFVLFADSTSLILANCNNTQLEIVMIEIFMDINNVLINLFS